MFFEDADAILHMLLVLALDILRLHGRLGGGGVANKLYYGRWANDEHKYCVRSGVVMCANANDNQEVFGVSHYRVCNIGIRTIYYFEFKNCDQKSVF